jgi:hypothetical protein
LPRILEVTRRCPDTQNRQTVLAGSFSASEGSNDFQPFCLLPLFLQHLNREFIVEFAVECLSKEDAVVSQAASEFFAVQVLQQGDGVLPGDVEKFLEIGDSELRPRGKLRLDLLLDLFDS